MMSLKGIWSFTAVLLVLVMLASGLVLPWTSPASADGPTEVSGVISSDTTWSAANSPYIVTGSILVQPALTLTIEAGVTVKFDSAKGLVIKGGLVARGTQASPILFTSNQGVPARGDWAYVMFAESAIDAAFDAEGNYLSGSILQYCTVEYAGSGSKTPAVKILASSPFMDHCTVRDNEKNGIYIDAPVDSLVISNSIITDNSTAGSEDVLQGGGIYADAETVTINNCTVTNNYARRDGGGIYTTGMTNIRGSTVSSNSANSSGGGIYADAETVTISNCTVTNNSAYSEGGGVWASGTVNVSDSTITNNDVSLNEGGGIFGAGKVNISNCTITNNSATRYGGGVYAMGTVVTISDSTISGNSAANLNGGGICVEDDPGPTTSSCTISNCTITNNTAGSWAAIAGGGGIDVSSDIININSSTISNNSAGYYGGGIRCFNDALNISDSSIAENTAGACGGGIYGTRVTAVDCVISGNSSLSSAASQDPCGGGGIYASFSVTVRYSEIVGNSASRGCGGGIQILGYGPINYNVIHSNTPFDVSDSNSWGTDDVDCTKNWWGTADEATIQAHIWDWSDDATVGIIDYSPWLDSPLTIMEGDVNRDGYVTLSDSTCIRQYLLGLRTLTPDQLKCADTNDDGKVSLSDSTIIRQWLLDPDGHLGILYKPLWQSPADDDMAMPLPRP